MLIKLKIKFLDKNNSKHKDLVDDTKKKPKLEAQLIKTFNSTLDFLTDNDLTTKNVNKKLDEEIVYDISKIQEIYLDNAEVIQTTSNAPNDLGLRNSKIGNDIGSLDFIQNGNKP